MKQEVEPSSTGSTLSSTSDWKNLLGAEVHSGLGRRFGKPSLVILLSFNELNLIKNEQYMRGFTDAQKEQYFRRSVSDEETSSRIISHIKTSRSLRIRCLIPVFCWITATVLDQMLTTDQRGELPKTLTDLYSHFLLVQTETGVVRNQMQHTGRSPTRDSQEPCWVRQTDSPEIIQRAINNLKEKKTKISPDRSSNIFQM
ncbi:hypothetical protein GBF38_021869 [Nibea albiflora]|uniref:Uncharacterized protein n=1 Tax=Nibea albiflora TaxID=240163 RepID=A0ACB7FGU8_NIBAL|nr:hypothetical protein GBF38_021869 [Nibea albiflora]